MLAEDECAIDSLIVARALKMHPAKRQWESDRSSQDASPGDKPVGGPTGVRALFNETLDKEIREENLGQANHVAWEFGRPKEYPPAPKPILACGRPPQPHGKAISNAKGGKHTSPGIRYKRRIVMLERAAADEDGNQQRTGYTQAPKRRVRCISSAYLSSDQNENSWYFLAFNEQRPKPRIYRFSTWFQITPVKLLLMFGFESSLDLSSLPPDDRVERTAPAAQSPIRKSLFVA